MSNKRITVAVKEAARLLKENPDWTHKKAMNKAKENLFGEGMGTIDRDD